MTDQILPPNRQLAVMPRQRPPALRPVGLPAPPPDGGGVHGVAIAPQAPQLAEVTAQLARLVEMQAERRQRTAPPWMYAALAMLAAIVLVGSIMGAMLVGAKDETAAMADRHFQTMADVANKISEAGGSGDYWDLGGLAHAPSQVLMAVVSLLAILAVLLVFGLIIRLCLAPGPWFWG